MRGCGIGQMHSLSLALFFFFFFLNFKEQPPEYYQVQKRDKAGHFIGRDKKLLSVDAIVPISDMADFF